MKSTLITIIVPTFNNPKGVVDIYSEIQKIPMDFELIVVDDGGTSENWNVLKKISEHQNVSSIRLSKNFGQHPATLAGFSIAKGDLIITLDDDHVSLVSELPLLIQAYQKEKKSLYYGMFSEKRTFLRRIATKIYRAISSCLGKSKGKGSSVRLMEKSLVDELSKESRAVYFIDELVLWFTDSIGYVNFSKSLGNSHSRYSIFGLMKIALRKSYFSSDKPLKWVALFGAMMAGINFIYGSWILYKKFIHKIEVEGFTSLIVSILFSTGMLMLSMGILAIYIRQILLRLNYAPLFSIKEKSE